MVQAYLGKPDYTNAMNQALRTRLEYDKRQGSGRISGASRSRNIVGPVQSGRGYEGREADTIEGSSPMEQTHARWKREAEIDALQASTAGQEKRTNIMGEISPEDLKAKRLANKMNESRIKDAQIDRTKTVLNNTLQHANAVTQESYRDLYDFAGESDEAAQGLLPHPDKVEGMSEVEWKVQQSKLVDMREVSPKKLKAAADAQIKKDAKIAKEEKLLEDAKDNYVKYRGLADKLLRTGGLSELEMMMMSDSNKKEFLDKSVEDQVALLNKRADLIKKKYPDIGFGGGQQLDAETAQGFLNEAGGDPELARKNAAEAGYSF